ncbi:YolD-like protein [Paenibacillus polysaccharolyticus]|uniref:YolD-like protein n=1 Tax=Paenibacillus polysaccharolyticus TaxID=582692 RepID=A0A1G5IL48_9BACL|nr:hypothetical protein [Paenibacillus intestini]SCY76855.1 YolD-like protein [Paenibacillus polysaccharolyticus]
MNGILIEYALGKQPWNRDVVVEEVAVLAKAKVAKRPTRDEFELEELGNQLVEAFHERSEVLLTVWGKEEQVQGIIVKMDSRTRLVHVEHTEEEFTAKVPFMDIMQVQSPRY